MGDYFDEENGLKDFSSEEVSRENPRTLFSPIIAVLENNEEKEDLERNKKFSNKNNLEVPAVLLSPCVRPYKSELSIRSVSSSSEFLAVPPSPLNAPRTRSTTTLTPEATLKTRGLPRKLSLSLPISSSSSEECTLGNNAFTDKDSQDAAAPSRDEEIFNTDHDSNEEEDCCKRHEEFAFAFSCNGHSFLSGAERDSTASLNSPSEEVTTETLNNGSGSIPVVCSTPELHRNRSTCCRNPSKQLCCLLRTNYTPLSTPNSECSSSRFSNQNLQEAANDGDNLQEESVLPDECHSCKKKLTDENNFPHLQSAAAATQSSSLCLSDKQTFLIPTYEAGCKQYSTPDLSPNESLPVYWRCSERSLAPVGDTLKVKRSLSARSKTAPRTRSHTGTSSTFLHPDMARFSGSNQSSSEESAKSLLQTRSSKASRHKTRKTSFHQKCPHASSSINSSTSSAFVESSGRSQSSFMKSFLSLISPSRLLSKFQSSSRHSVQSSRSVRRKPRHIDFPDDDKVVTLNVSGRRFQIRDYFLTIYPNTLLGGKARSLFYDNIRNEFFFDRDPDTFRYIWNFYHSGQLHCPREECIQSFLDEVAFFGLDISMLCECCWQETFETAYERLTKRREEREASEKEAAEVVHVLDPNASFREKAWITLKEPSFSRFAKIFYLFSVFVIVVSVVTNTTETIPCQGAIRICKEENEDIYFYMDTVCVGFFTFEYVTRLAVCPNRLKFIINQMSIVDLLAILPFYIDLLLNALSFDAQLGMNALVVLRVLRILRIFKLLRHSKRLKKLIQSMKDSATELGLIGFVYLVMVILFSSIIYFTEAVSEDTQFSSIPEAMWYAVITSTTAG